MSNTKPTQATTGFFPLYYRVIQNGESQKKYFFSKVINKLSIITLNILGLPYYNETNKIQIYSSFLKRHSLTNQTYGVYPLFYISNETISSFGKENYFSLAKTVKLTHQTKLLGIRLHTTIDFNKKTYWILSSQKSNTHFSKWF